MAEQTVMTPKAVTLSFQTCKLSEITKIDADEFFYFVYPSPNVLDAMNGDGNLYEIFDYNKDFSKIDTIRGNENTHPDLKIYYPCPKNVIRIVVEMWNRDLYHLQANRGKMGELHWGTPTDEDIEGFGEKLSKALAGLQDTVVLVQRIRSYLLQSERQEFDTFIGKMKKSISKYFTVDEESVALQGHD